jgi:hypothetical protein
VQLLPYRFKRQPCRFARLAETDPTAGSGIKSVHSLVINHNASTPGIRSRILRKFVANSLQIATRCNRVAQLRLDFRGKL